ncbi:MAG: hypothetical protein WC455_21585 [Dehalococcoidia bacterium]|jgi:hypothetical protein
MSMKLVAIVNSVRQKLRDEFVSGTDFEWKDDELRLIINDCLIDISRVSPRIVREVLPTVDESKQLAINGISDLMWIVRAEYPVGNNPPSYHNVEQIDNEIVELKITSTPEAGTTGTLTGTVTFANNSTAVSGAGTAFSTELAADYHIKKSTGTRWYRIKSVTSDTALVLDEVSLDTGADTVSVTQYSTDEVAYLYCAKPHTLTESASTLNPIMESLLILGTSGQAAINRAQSLIGSVNIGGASTPAQLQAWGATQIQLFRAGLSRLSGNRKSEVYPEG